MNRFAIYLTLASLAGGFSAVPVTQGYANSPVLTFSTFRTITRVDNYNGNGISAPSLTNVSTFDPDKADAKLGHEPGDFKTRHLIMAGAEWLAMSPEERGAFLTRQAKLIDPNFQGLAGGRGFVLEVPSGNLWVMDAGEIAQLGATDVLEAYPKGWEERLPLDAFSGGDNEHQERRTGDPYKDKKPAKEDSFSSP